MEACSEGCSLGEDAFPYFYDYCAWFSLPVNQMDVPSFVKKVGCFLLCVGSGGKGLLCTFGAFVYRP